MKRVTSSDSDSLGVAALISICPASVNGADEHGLRSNNIYTRDYQSLLDDLDEEGYIEESGNVRQKKRRLSLEQVKGLENYFEVENKLEPERKVKLARELGLQPRQVAVWFQNRRARWKTKQLERDYGLLKSSFDALKHNYDHLQQDKDALLKEIKLLKSKLNEENDMCIKDEVLMYDSGDNAKSIEPISPPPSLSGVSDDPKLFRDGPSESDSSAILNEDNNNNNNNNNNSPNASSAEQVLIMSPNSTSAGVNCSSSSTKCFSFTESRSEALGSGLHNDDNDNNVYYPQLVKLEEHNFFSGEEACNFFSDEAAPTLHWYCADQWT